MSTINDLLRRVPMLAVLPLIVWLFGMTAWTASWKAETDYKLSLVMKTSTAIEEQSDRVIAIEQKLIYLTDYVREMKDALKEKSK
jgi:hypothetical protein